MATWLKTSQGSSVRAHLHTTHGERLIDCSLSVPRFVPFRVCLLYLALPFPLLPVLCPEPLLPCGRRQGKHYLRLRQSRRLALWHNSLLPHRKKEHDFLYFFTGMHPELRKTGYCAQADDVLQRLKLCRMSAEQEEHEVMQDLLRGTSLELYVNNTGGCQRLECRS